MPAPPVLSTGVDTPTVPAATGGDRPKPADVAFAPSEKFVFPLPPKAVATAEPPVTRSAPVVMPIPATLPPPAAPAGTGTATPGVATATTVSPTPTTTPATPPGDRTMNLKQATAAAVIGGALAFTPATPAVALPLPPAAPAPAAPPLPVVRVSPAPPTAPVPPPPAPLAEAVSVASADPKDTKDAKEKTTDEKLTDIQKDLKRLTELLDGRRDETGVKLPSDVGLIEEMKRLRDEVARLRSQVDDMRKSTTALRPSGGGTTTTPAPVTDPIVRGTGTVRVVNDYPVEITIVINNSSYRVAANTKLDVSIPAGDFSYQLLSAGSNLAQTRSTIKDKEVVTLRIK